MATSLLDKNTGLSVQAPIGIGGGRAEVKRRNLNRRIQSLRARRKARREHNRSLLRKFIGGIKEDTNLMKTDIPSTKDKTLYPTYSPPTSDNKGNGKKDPPVVTSSNSGNKNTGGKQDKLIGGQGWGLTDKAQESLPKWMQNLGVGQTEKTVTIFGKEFKFTAPDPRKKRKAKHGGWVYDK